jgi:hypothetical protein
MPWETNFWPDGLVPYEFDDNVTQVNRDRMLAAMSEWTAVADITFRPRTVEFNYVHIQNSTRNNSPIGMRGGRQIINIASWGSPFVMVHELAHTLAFYHEHSRSDRDTFVRINWDHVLDGQEAQFQLEPSSRRYGPYDFDSVMHYRRAAFSSDGQDTITVLPPNGDWQGRIGQRTHLSRMDKLIMGFNYAFWLWRFVDGSYPGFIQLGTFAQPYRNFVDGVNSTPTGGTPWIQPGTYSAVRQFDRAMTWQAPLADVTLGN